MTTIACDGKTMAGDSLTTGGGERVGWTTKVKRAKDGRIFGCAGMADESKQFARWMDGGDEPILSDEFEALILNLDGFVHWIGRKLEPLEYFTPMTIGSGAGLALGAMLAGKSPAEEVSIAIQRDIKSGGEVVALSIEPSIKAVA